MGVGGGASGGNIILCNTVGEQGIQGLNGEKGDVGEHGIQGLEGDKGDVGEHGIQELNEDTDDVGEQGIQGLKCDSPEESNYVTSTYTSNHEAATGFGIINLGNLENKTSFTNIPSFRLTIAATIPKTKITKYQIGSKLPLQASRDWTLTFFDEKDVQVGANIKMAETFSSLET